MSSFLCGTCVRQQEEMGEKEEKGFGNVTVDLRSQSDVYCTVW